MNLFDHFGVFLLDFDHIIFIHFYQLLHIGHSFLWSHQILPEILFYFSPCLGQRNHLMSFVKLSRVKAPCAQRLTVVQTVEGQNVIVQHAFRRVLGVENIFMESNRFHNLPLKCLDDHFDRRNFIVDRKILLLLGWSFPLFSDWSRRQFFLGEGLPKSVFIHSRNKPMFQIHNEGIDKAAFIKSQ